TGKTTVSMVGPGNSTPTISVSAAPSQTLSANPGTLSAPISLSLTSSSNASSVTVSYPTRSGGTVTQNLSGSHTSWSFSVPANTTTYDVGNETFSFTATFSGGTTRTGFVTIALYDPALGPDVTNLAVNVGGTGSASFCVDQTHYQLFSNNT